MTDITDKFPLTGYSDTPSTPRDHSLFLTATATWNDSRRNLHALIAEAPAIRPTIAQFIAQRLNLQSNAAYLSVEVDGEEALRRIELAEACAFLARHGDLDGQDLSTLNAIMPAGHALSGLTLRELLAKLKALDPTTFVIHQWDRYWKARQPDTAVSRRDHALQQYHDHLHCACELAYAQGKLTLEQIKPLRLAMEIQTGVANLGDQPILIDTLGLTEDASGIRKLPGALVFTVEGQAPASQLLYLPSHTPALLAFPHRNALEQYLLQQKAILWPSETRLSTGDHLVYGRQPDIRTAFFGLVDLLRNNMISCLYHNPGAQLAEAGAQTLAPADAFDILRRNYVLLAEAPTLAAQDLDEDLAPSLFGQLYANLELGSRQASIKLQRDAFAALMGAEPRNHGDDQSMQRLSKAIDQLHEQQNQARIAAGALLIADTPDELVQLATRRSIDYQALLSARLEALKAEAQIQHTLKQLDDADYAAITQVTDWPTAAQRLDDDIIAATLQLNLTEGDITQAQALDAVLLIIHKEALTDAASLHSLLVYWPGEGGGLQRYSSRAELQRHLLKITHNEEALTLSLNMLRGHALAHGLLAQLQDCEKAAKALVGQFADTADRTTARQALAALREQHLAHLLVPSHDARETAYAHALELDHSSMLHQHMPGWLGTLSADDRARLKALIQQYVPAMRRSQNLLERELVDREVFVRTRLRERLKSELTLMDEYHVSFDLPESVTFVRDIVAGSGAAGTPIKLIPKPSLKRTNVPLEQLAIQNVDDDMRLRFDYMKPVITGGTAQGRALLESTMTFAYVKKLVTNLDLAEAYTQLIRSVFMGKSKVLDFHDEHRRERLLKPFQLMLSMQSILGLHRHLLDTTAQSALDSAISRNGDQYGPRVTLHAARMKTDERVNDNKGTDLSGMCFIEEPISGQTLLYLEEDPRGQYVSHYPSLEEARKALFTLTLDDSMANYVAARALHGEARVHLGRLRQAHLSHYDSLMEVSDVTLIPSLSLADYLLESQMRRLIETHRRSSRSNQDRQVELAAEKRELIFNFVKMGVGMVPFIGTAVGLYDGVQAAALMLNAIGRKDSVETLAQFESLMLCVIDAAMDLAPGAGIASVRGATRSRQLRRLSNTPGSLRVNTRKNGHGGQRFAGYEYTQEVDLSSVQLATVGKYRNVYRHAQGNFIVEEGRTFQVEFHESPATWRLKGNHTKTYKQPIALDESGQWHTHGKLYGTLINNGLAGGGGTLGHLADNLEPFWPEPIRRYLPRWLIDRTLHRQQALNSSISQKVTALQVLRQRTASLRDTPLVSAADRPRAEASSVTIMQRGAELYDDLVKESVLVLRRNLRRNIEFRSDVADLIAQEIIHQISLKTMTLNDLTMELNSIGSVPGQIISVDPHTLKAQRTKRVQILQIHDEVDNLIPTLDEWIAKVTRNDARTDLNKTLADIKGPDYTIARATHQSQLLHHSPDFDDVEGLYHLHEMVETRTPFNNSVSSHHELDKTNATRPEKRKILESCLHNYKRYKQQVNTLAVLRPEQFDLQRLPAMNVTIDRMIRDARDRLGNPTTGGAKPAKTGTGASRQRVFETVENLTYLGEETPASATSPRTFKTQGSHGEWQTWVEVGGNRWQQLDAVVSPVQHIGSKRLVAEARAYLEGTDARIQAIESQAGWSAKDIEDTLLAHARQLRLRADKIAGHQPDHVLVKQLRDKAEVLQTKGRDQHVRARLDEQYPEAGDLDYLLEQKSVDIVRSGTLVELHAHGKGQKDFLQEYEIRDLSQQPPSTLWYAHFHYRRADAPFEQFAKAHIKRLDQKDLGLKWQQAQVEPVPIHRGDINRTMAEKHFRAHIQ